MLEIYTDGACRGNGVKDNTPGGWGYVILKDGEKVYEGSGGIKNTTNNRMEMTAAIEALIFLKEKNLLDSVEALYTDSAYIQNCYAQKWYENWAKNGWKTARKEPVKNKDLWQLLTPFFSKIEFKKVKGHSNIEWNEYVDKLAVKGALSVGED